MITNSLESIAVTAPNMASRQNEVQLITVREKAGNSLEGLLNDFTFILNRDKLHIRSEMATLESLGELNETSINYFSNILERSLEDLASHADVRLSHAKIMRLHGSEGLSHLMRHLPLLFDTKTDDWQGFMPVDLGKDEVDNLEIFIVYAESLGPNKWPLAAIRRLNNHIDVPYELGYLSSLGDDAVEIIHSIAGLITTPEQSGSYGRNGKSNSGTNGVKPALPEDNPRGEGFINMESSSTPPTAGSAVKKSFLHTIGNALKIEPRTSSRYKPLQLSDTVNLSPRAVLDGKFDYESGKYTTPEAVALLSDGFFPIIIPDFNREKIGIAQLDLRGLGLSISDGNNAECDGMFTFQTFDKEGNLTELERERLKIVTKRYREKDYVTGDKLQKGLYIDGLGERGYQAPIIWIENGVATAGMRFILPNIDPYHGVTRVINGSELGWLELPFHEHLPEPYRSLAREGIYHNYVEGTGYDMNGPIDLSRIVAWTEVSQLARLKGEGGHKGDIWKDIYGLLIKFGGYLRGSHEYHTLVKGGTKLGVAVSASPLIAKKMVGPEFRGKAWLSGLKIAQIGPTRFARGSDETPIIIYPA